MVINLIQRILDQESPYILRLEESQHKEGEKKKNNKKSQGIFVFENKMCFIWEQSNFIILFIKVDLYSNKSPILSFHIIGVT